MILGSCKPVSVCENQGQSFKIDPIYCSLDHEGNSSSKKSNCYSVSSRHLKVFEKTLGALFKGSNKQTGFGFRFPALTHLQTGNREPQAPRSLRSNICFSLSIVCNLSLRFCSNSTTRQVIWLSSIRALTSPVSLLVTSTGDVKNSRFHLCQNESLRCLESGIEFGYVSSIRALTGPVSLLQLEM